MRQEKRVLVSVNIEPAASDKLWLEVCDLDEPTETVAAMLTHRLQHWFHDRTVAIRREAYDQGWRDAKARRKKATQFANTFIMQGDGRPGW